MLNLEYKKRQGFMQEAPLEVDKTSSPSTVYLRKDIKKIEAVEDTAEHWEYEEAQLTKEEYIEYLEQIAQLKSAPMQALMQRMSDLELAIAENSI